MGKRTIFESVKAHLAASVQAVGFCTMNEAEKGFRSIDIADPSRTVKLATLENNAAAISDDHFIGPYRVHHDDTIHFFRKALEAATGNHHHLNHHLKPMLVHMDEVGALLLSAELEELFTHVAAETSGCHCCFGTLPPPGLHKSHLVESLRARSDVAVLEVTLGNRSGMIDTACLLLYHALFPPSVSKSIEAEAALARRYVTELNARFLLDHPPLAYRFRGDHGHYAMSRKAASDDLECACPSFYTKHCTCSHTLALALRREHLLQAMSISGYRSADSGAMLTRLPPASDSTVADSQRLPLRPRGGGGSSERLSDGSSERLSDGITPGLLELPFSDERKAALAVRAGWGHISKRLAATSAIDKGVRAAVAASEGFDDAVLSSICLRHLERCAPTYQTAGDLKLHELAHLLSVLVGSKRGTRLAKAVLALLEEGMQETWYEKKLRRQYGANY